MGFEPRTDILPAAQQNFWLERPQIPPTFVLYGGTAIAVRLGHRSSEDFDFFSSETFETTSLLAALPFATDAVVLQSAPNTLTLRVERGGPVKLSFFGRLTFGRAGVPDTVEGQSFSVASLPDLFAAKLQVLWQRAEAKDYLDVAALLRAGVSLEYGLGCAVAVYGEQFNPAIVLKALTYFEDGDLPTIASDIRRLLIDAAANVREIPELRCASPRLANGR
jgi:Nucleotidyl transferase AbiEii toxin, Type IV TA system